MKRTIFPLGPLLDNPGDPAESAPFLYRGTELRVMYRPRPKKRDKGVILQEGAMQILPQNLRYETAKRWALRRTGDELVHAVAVLLQKRAEDRMELFFRYRFGEQVPQIVRSCDARKKAYAKQAKNPMAKAKSDCKAEAFKLWQERDAGKHPALRTNDQFATECCRRWPVLTSIGTVLKWSTQWHKEAKARARRKAKYESAGSFVNVLAE